MEKQDKIPMPPLDAPRELFLPLDFWMDVIAYLDKRTELVCMGSGHGEVEVVLKFHKSKVFEVNFQERIRVREIIEKAGARANPNPLQEPTLG